MRIHKIVFASLSVAFLCAGSAAVAQADTIAFVGTRDFTNGPPATPNPARCGAPPNLLSVHPPGVGASNLGSFTSTESHCINVATGNVSNGLFTFDFGGGNSFFGTYVGTVTLPGPPPFPPGTVVPVSFTFTLTGGTGLFTSAGGNLLGTGTTTFTPAGTSSHIDITGTVTTVPEPVTLVLLGTGLAGVAVRARQRHKVRGS